MTAENAVPEDRDVLGGERRLQRRDRLRGHGPSFVGEVTKGAVPPVPSLRSVTGPPSSGR
ncbi:hypothetical protein GCM10010151_63120 [Actinoallomurus spadix]|uniref:Uncharacterized protein n=1 Tax=Actinoallomurus spadix TaxID=79912 RepID=A0ABN0XHV8_9ACTN